MIIGLTGPMASGKNLACSLLEKTGCVSVDADILAHEAIEKAKNAHTNAHRNLSEKRPE